ncbi:MAG: glucose 1-dehydrogenase [Alphaproteobacteria bacterium]|nr:glucose 1-dehydrogenase [Alphaproteobacteria bacterium]MCW5744166.1 glucose 1-dehydrogenase [Alphaproteobacteria bacterium]
MAGAFDLKGKVAVVTGGNGGIGLGMARGMAEAGAAIVVAGRNTQKNEAAVAALKGTGAEASSVVVDVNDEKQCAAMVAHAVTQHGRLDILINNAGINVRKPPHEISVAEWTLVLNTNLTSAMVCSQLAHPEMKKTGGGKVINIGSMMSIFGAPYTPAYAASKGGIVQFTKVCATAWAKDNIQVNAVLPGWIDTELTSNARREVPGLHERVLSRTPAGRWGTPQDMAGIAVFLASPASDFVTGAAIPVDGGFAVLG